MLLIVWIVVSLLILSWFTRIIIRFLTIASVLLTRSSIPAQVLYIVFFFPGVVIHELSHFLIASILQVPTGKIELLPYKIGKEIKLGSVKVARTDILRTSIVGTAPLLVGTAVIYLLLSINYPFLFRDLQISGIVTKFTSQFTRMDAAIVYLMFTISNTMLLSKNDKRGIIPALILIGAFTLVTIYLAQDSLDFIFVFQMLNAFLLPLAVTFSTILLINLILFVPLLLFVQVFQKITGKKVKITYP